MKRLQKGQTIIEAIVALATILLIITAITIVVVSGLYNSAFVKNQNEANKYAQQGMELVRNIQVNNLGSETTPDTFVYFVTHQGTSLYCISGSTLTTLNCQNGNVNTGTSFNRTIEFTQNAAQCSSGADDDLDNNSVLVTVNVSWSSSKCSATDTFCHKSVLKACLPFRYPASQP